MPVRHGSEVPRENQTPWSLLSEPLVTRSQGQPFCDVVTPVLYSLQESGVQTAPAAHSPPWWEMPQAGLTLPDFRCMNSCKSGLDPSLLESCRVPSALPGRLSLMRCFPNTLAPSSSRPFYASPDMGQRAPPGVVVPFSITYSSLIPCFNKASKCR